MSANLDEEIAELIAVGASQRASGDLDAAVESYKRALLIGKSGADPSLLGVAAGDLGVIHDLRGESSLPRQFYEMAITFYKSADDQEGAIGQYINLAIFERRLGNFKAATDCLEHASNVLRDHTPDRLMAKILATYGLIFMTSGHLDFAERYYSYSLDIATKLDEKTEVAACLGNLGCIYHLLGRLDDAEQMHTHSLSIHLTLDLRNKIASDYSNLGLVHLSKKDFATAEALFNLALDIDTQLGHLPAIGNHLGNLGDLFASQGERRQATVYWEKAKLIFEKISSPHLTAQIDERIRRSAHSWIDQDGKSDS